MTQETSTNIGIQWIDIKEMKPKPCEPVIVFVPTGNQLREQILTNAYYNGSEWWDKWWKINPTHWIPFPHPPVENKPLSPFDK